MPSGLLKGFLIFNVWCIIIILSSMITCGLPLMQPAPPPPSMINFIFVYTFNWPQKKRVWFLVSLLHRIFCQDFFGYLPKCQQKNTELQANKSNVSFISYHFAAIFSCKPRLLRSRAQCTCSSRFKIYYLNYFHHAIYSCNRDKPVTAITSKWGSSGVTFSKSTYWLRWSVHRRLFCQYKSCISALLVTRQHELFLAQDLD